VPPPSGGDDIGWPARGRLVVVDPDAASRHHVVCTLRSAGFEVLGFATGDHLPAAADGAELLVVELQLPRASCLELCRDASSSRGVGVLVVSSGADDDDRVLALEAGADDVVVKPFADRELVLRVQAVLRRVRRQASTTWHGPLVAGSLQLDLTSRCATVDGAKVSLTPKESALLAILIEADGRLVARQHLLQSVWGTAALHDQRTLDVHILRLRKKLIDPAHGVHLDTVRGRGYRLSAARHGA
jgi:two-component system response regulator ResD